MLTVFFAVAMAAVATAANAPVTSADLVTPGDQYPMPQGLDSWSSVLADVFMQKVFAACAYDRRSFVNDIAFLSSVASSLSPRPSAIAYSSLVGVQHFVWSSAGHVTWHVSNQEHKSLCQEVSALLDNMCGVDMADAVS